MAGWESGRVYLEWRSEHVKEEAMEGMIWLAQRCQTILVGLM